MIVNTTKFAKVNSPIKQRRLRINFRAKNDKVVDVYLLDNDKGDHAFHQTMILRNKEKIFTY